MSLCFSSVQPLGKNFSSWNENVFIIVTILKFTFMLVCFIWMLFNIWSKMGPPSTHCPGFFQMSLHFRAILPKSLLEIGFVSKYGYGIFYFHFIFMFSIFTEKRGTLIFVQMSVRVFFFFFFNYPLGLYKMKLEELPLIYPLRSFCFWFILYNQKALSPFI